MRCLERNKQTFYYCLYWKIVPIYLPLDGDDSDQARIETGESKVLYHRPVKLRANVSAAKGEAQIEQFGSSLQYDRVITLCDMSCPIDENTVLYIDKIPTKRFEGRLIHNDDHDYVVVRVAKHLNTISIAIRKVDVS